MHVNPDGSQSTMAAREIGQGPGECRLVVLAKEPEPARVKTRLCPPLTPEAASECHEAFVADTLARLREALPAADRVLAITPGPERAPRLERLARSYGWRAVDQGGGSLGARIRRMLEAGVAERHRVVLVGADTPDLPLERVRAAFSRLEHGTLVLGPATDGGYYLVGCRSFVPNVFGPGIAWGTSTVWRDTLALIRASEPLVTAEVLPEWSDVDDWAGLAALAERIRQSSTRYQDGDEQLPAATIRFLHGLRRSVRAL